MNIYLFGQPDDVGGANTKIWHTLRLWRRMGLDVTVIPLWTIRDRWHHAVTEIGCRVLRTNADELGNLPGLPGAICVSMCNLTFLRIAAPILKDLGARLVWLGSMNYLFPGERHLYGRQGTFDRHVFDSNYQRAVLAPQLARYGYDDQQDGRMIHGYLDLDLFPFRPRPHPPGTQFVLGRLSREALEKFAWWFWWPCVALPGSKRFEVMGWYPALRGKCGNPPDGAMIYRSDRVPVPEFLGRLHCLAMAGDTAENWPRVGLEAMAAGVPVVADRRGGWLEMIDHGVTGLLCDGPEEMTDHLATLASDEPRRLAMAEAARASVEQLSDAQTIGGQWLKLFGELGNGRA